MATQRRIRVFKNGSNRAMRIPVEFEFAGDEVIMRKQGNRLIIEPIPPKSLLGVLASLKPLKENLPYIPDLPPDEVDI